MKSYVHAGNHATGTVTLPQENGVPFVINGVT